jgi:hypothetical protein
MLNTAAGTAGAPVQPAGHAGLREHLKLAVPPPAHTGFVGNTSRRTETDGDRTRELAALQGQIVNPRYAATGWRTEQPYVGRTVAEYRFEA